MTDVYFVSEFTKLQTLLAISDNDLGDELRVSQPSITLWKEGKNLPHKVMRAAIITYMQTKLIVAS